MRSDPVLNRLYKDIAAKTAAKARIKRKVMERIQLPDMKTYTAPSPAIKQAIWERVYARITAVPTPQIVWPQRTLKLTAAFALLALAVRMSPYLFLVPPTVADSEVTLLPVGGEVSVAIAGMWQPVSEELTLQPGMMIRGEATLLFHDDGVVRTDENTTIQLHDIAKRAEPTATDVHPTLTLYTGRVWVQGLVPSHVRGVTVATSFGDITVNEGSVSIAEDDVVDVYAFNRRAVVEHGGQSMVLVAGERTQLWEGNIPLIKKLAHGAYQEGWVAQNLARDAVHRREIAQLQQERRAARAGILPTSPLYSVKRVAETVDVLLTFDEEARTQKRIDQAERRLDEAAALLADNQEDAHEHLAEYRETLQELALETEESALIEFLLQQSITETSTEVAAAQPEDDAYVIKLAVLEASTELESARNALELEAVLVMDALAAAQRSLDQAQYAEARKQWIDLESSLAILDEVQLPADVRKEVVALLGDFAREVQEYDQQFAGIDAAFTKHLAAYVPAEYTEEAVASLSDEELQQLVQDIRSRIFVYHMRQSRLNQMYAELKALAGHPEEGRILRRLYTVLPGGPENFPERIQKEITRLRWERAADTI